MHLKPMLMQFEYLQNEVHFVLLTNAACAAHIRTIHSATAAPPGRVGIATLHVIKHVHSPVHCRDSPDAYMVLLSHERSI